MQLSIIIVNYNVKYFLEQCLCSVLKACGNITAEIIVVDNHSTDGSKEFFANRFAGVKFLWEKQNVGYAIANNKGLRIATGEKVLFLNPDTIVPEDCFTKCIEFFEQHDNTGALGVKMIDGSGNYLPESKRGFPTSFIALSKITGLARLFPKSRIFSGYYMGHIAANQTNEVDVLPGAFMMIEKKILDHIGGFDEQFFMYGEDIDLSYGIKKAGYKNYYFPHVTILHFKGESTSKASAKYVQHFYGAMILFAKKHSSKWQSSLYALLLKGFIRFKTLFLSNKKKQMTEQTHSDRKVFVLAETSTYLLLKKMLQQNFKESQQQPFIDNNLSVDQAILFCEPYNSFKQIIETIEKNRNKHYFFIHSVESKSIIGSADKTTQGTALSVE